MVSTSEYPPGSEKYIHSQGVEHKPGYVYGTTTLPTNDLTSGRLLYMQILSPKNLITQSNKIVLYFPMMYFFMVVIHTWVIQLNYTNYLPNVHLSWGWSLMKISSLTSFRQVSIFANISEVSFLQSPSKNEIYIINFLPISFYRKLRHYQEPKFIRVNKFSRDKLENTKCP